MTIKLNPIETLFKQTESFNVLIVTDDPAYESRSAMVYLFSPAKDDELASIYHELVHEETVLEQFISDLTEGSKVGWLNVSDIEIIGIGDTVCD